MRAFLMTLSFVGVSLFGGAFVASLTSPQWVESSARELLRKEVERRVDERIELLDGSRLVALAQGVTGRNAERIEGLKRQLAEGLPAKVAVVVAEMGQYDCACREAIERNVSGSFGWRIADLSSVNERLELLIRSAYMDVAEKLLRELRIFTGANALVFLLLGAVTLVRRGATTQLALPALVLVGAAVVTGTFYLFGQDWLRTVVFSQYVGYGYFAYLGVAVGFLADIAFNQARVTSAVVDTALSLVGGVAKAAPC